MLPVLEREKWSVPLVTDPLSEVLSSVRLQSIVMERSNMTAPWGFRMPVDANGRIVPPAGGFPHDALMPPPVGGAFFAVLEGSCWFEVEGAGAAIELRKDDLALMVPARTHVFKDHPSTVARPLWEVAPLPHSGGPCRPHFPEQCPSGAPRTGGSAMGAEGPRGQDFASPSVLLKAGQKFPRPPALNFGGGGAPVAMLVGLLFFERSPDRRLLSALPPVLHARGGPNGAPWVRDVLSALEREVAGGGPGTVSVMSRLAHALFDHAVRDYVLSLPQPSSAPSADHSRWMQALMDEEIGPALAMMHQRPQQQWTVQSLADHVAMSRSTFAERFNSAVGEPPMQYLVGFRMTKAEAMLREGSLPVKEVAARVGYGSLAAFSNAFKRERGVSPGKLRQ